jgi:CobQ-like glutamine amidotransferase family enzyme
VRVRDSAATIVLLYPDLLGTYGDGGNATILAQRLRWRGRPAEVVTVRADDPVPASGQVYVVGGGEDLPQALAARQLGRRGPLHQAVEQGAAVLAICAGLQILGTSFVGPDGVETDGLGLVDIRSVRGRGHRAVGELVVQPGFSTGLPTLSGYENHGGVTHLGQGVRPLGQVRVGVGNGTAPETAPGHRPMGLADGFLVDRLVGTYLHGPALARNPALADYVLASAFGELEPLDDTVSEELRQERLAAAGSRGAAAARGGWRRRLRAAARR